MASFRAARAARHREQQARSRRIRPELAARAVVTVAGLSAALLMLCPEPHPRRVGAVLFALLVLFGWRWVEGIVEVHTRRRVENQIAADLASALPPLARRDTPASAESAPDHR